MNQSSSVPSQASNNRHDREVVVLVHGLAAVRAIMWRMQRRLEQSGFRTLNHGYWSTRDEIPAHGRRLLQRLLQLQEDPTIDRIHLVTHSMGCIIGRWMLGQQPLDKVARWVMLAPPNHGSHAADFLRKFLGNVIIPLHQLSERPDSFVNTLSDFQKVNDVQFAIVEAKYDRVIVPENVTLAGAKEHVVVESHHGTLPLNETAIEFTDRFLTAVG